MPFARCGDGVARHVSRVTDRDQGPFNCLGCAERLTFRKPTGKRRHFAHQPDASCKGETVLHQYAKELLAARKTLSLPEYVLEMEGVKEVVFESATYDFDIVQVEQRLDTFQPDAVVSYRGVELAVEFLVTHAVDRDKRAKVRGRDLSMVEIDLSELNDSRLDADDLDNAILHSARRYWVHHRKTAAARKRLDAAVAEERVQRGARLRGHILRRRRAEPPAGWIDGATAAVKRAGLEEFVGLEVAGDHWFAVPAAVWQAETLYRQVIKPSELSPPGERKQLARGVYPRERDLSSVLPDWMIRTDLGNYPPDRLAEAGFTSQSYGSPHGAVWLYLRTLAAKREVVGWSKDDKQFFVLPELQGLLYRRAEFRRVVTRLLEAAEVGDSDAAYQAWSGSFRVGARSAAEVADVGGDDYRSLMARLRRLQSMASGYEPVVVEDLCGLPLEAIRSRRQEQIDEREAKRVAELQKAAEARVARIVREAEYVLGDEAPDWLARRVRDTDVTYRDYAGESEEAFTRLEASLTSAGKARQGRLAAERMRAELRTRLIDAVRRAFPTEERANLFPNSGHTSLRGKRPIDACESEQDFTFITSLLPKKR